jgi:anti-sigma factor RsiW
MKRCVEIEPLLYRRVADALTAEEIARVDAHLAACAACREESARILDVLDMARTRPFSGRPRVAPLAGPSDMAAATLSRWKHRQRRRATAIALAAGAAAVAAAASLALMPGIHAPARERSHPPAPAAEGWEPDVDGAWDAAGVLELEPGADLAAADDELFSLETNEQ